jgi:hypothetical protein
VVLIRGKSAKAYAVRSSILDWKPDNYGNYGPATNKRANGVPSDPSHNGALPVIPPPPQCPANFSELSAEQRQNYLLSSAMYLQARLLNSGIALEAQDARAIAQLANVAQGIVQTSVKLEQIKAEQTSAKEKREETIRYLLTQIPGKPGGT